MDRRKFLTVATGGAFAAANRPIALAAAVQEISIGAIYPMSGSSAAVGAEARHAIDTAADIINGEHDLDLPLARSSGLPGLGGAKVKVLFADHQGDPEKGRAEAERLLTQNNVCAIVGAFQSSVSATVSTICERYATPYICADSSSPSLSRRGLKYFFRPSATDDMFSATMFEFLDRLRAMGVKVETIALLHEDTVFGSDSSRAQKALAERRGYRIAVDVEYRSNSPSLTSEVQKLKSADADVLMPSCYTTDAILLVRTMFELGYRPRAIIAQAAGFADPALYRALGKRLEGVITRASFSLDLGVKRRSIFAVNKMYRASSGIDLSDNSSRQLTGLLVAAEAIDRARSVKGVKIREALAATSLPGGQTIMPWRGIKFDATGQNTLADPVLLQYVDGVFKTIYPKDLAVSAAIWPMHA